MAAGIQTGLQKATGFRSLSYRQAHEMLMSISYLCYASTDDVLSFLELRSQQGFSNPLSRECSGLRVSVLFTAILGISTAQEEVVVPIPPALKGSAAVLFLATTQTCLPP